MIGYTIPHLFTDLKKSLYSEVPVIQLVLKFQKEKSEVFGLKVLGY
jgi:hypothetical protein